MKFKDYSPSRLILGCVKMNYQKRMNHVAEIRIQNILLTSTLLEFKDYLN